MGSERLSWYWHRLRAMDAAEMRCHAAKKWAQWIDGVRGGPSPRTVGSRLLSRYPILPDRNNIPEGLADSLKNKSQALRSGAWSAFGHIPLQVDMPPQWHKDYLAGIDLRSTRPASKLNHRNLDRGADIKLVWELSRWSPLVQLAQSAWIHQDLTNANLVVNLLEDWIASNPAYRGWNWTSALESGLRLIQLGWIETLLKGAAPGLESRLDAVVDQIIPAHVSFTWRHRSFGSSANNHLLGELAGLIITLCARTDLENLASPVVELQRLWEQEVLAQFAPDGGNREQALNYQLFGFELCWQTRLALGAAGYTIRPEVLERLSRAVDFFVTVQVEPEPWDYGDSDSAFATPVCSSEETVAQEWLGWMNESAPGRTIQFWLGSPPPPCPVPACVTLSPGRLHFPDSGQVRWTDGRWNLRWDLSELGYLATAAHGHLDALHVSLWIDSLALVIDPGTGAYYGDRRFRAHLASWESHNGPIPVQQDFPRRAGPFLWSEQHERPVVSRVEEWNMRASLPLPSGNVERTITRLVGDQDGWQVDDNFTPSSGAPDVPFTVFWQFAPGWIVEKLHERQFLLTRQGVTIEIGLDAAWRKSEWFIPTETSARYAAEGDLVGICSRRFREVQRAPALRLEARGHNPCLFRTTFLASRAS